MAILRENYSEEEVCGRYVTYPKTDKDTEGGLRTKGILKKDTKEYPLITYITVVYNRVDTIKRCMESVFKQTYPNVEYIIVDGNSTDGTLQLIEEAADRIDYYISQPDKGIYNAMNKGISLARGRFLCFMNSDDECVIEAAQRVVEEYKKTGADLICGVRNLYMNGQKVDEYTYPRYCIKHSTFRYIQMYHQATYASYEIFNKIGGFDENYSLLSDWIWESAAIDADATVDFCNEVLTNFNYDGASFKGIVKRDDEWIKWTIKSFPELSKEDAELFVYSLDRERHPMFSFDTLWKVAVKYEKDLNFQKAFYEDSLLACLEACHDIRMLSDKSRCNTKPIFKKYNIEEMIGVKSFAELEEWFDKRLQESIPVQDENIFKNKKELLHTVSVIRSFQIDVLLKIYKRECLYISNPEYCLQALGRYLYYLNGKRAGKNANMSRNFYLNARASWNID